MCMHCSPRYVTSPYTQDELFPLYYASRGGYDGIVEMLIQAGSTVDLQNKVSITEPRTFHPTHCIYPAMYALY